MRRTTVALVTVFLGTISAISPSQTPLAQVIRSTERRLDSDLVRYSCSEFKSAPEDKKELLEAVYEATVSGEYSLYCLAQPKATSGRVGIRDGALVIFVRKDGTLRQPYWMR